MARVKSFIGGIVVGAGALYALRPGERGRTRSGGAPAVDAPRYGSRLGDIAGLEAATLETGDGRAAPRLATALRIAGAALVLYSALRRGRLSAAARAVGLGLLARGGLGGRGPVASSAAIPSPVPRDRRQIVDIQKTFYIEAPVDQVYAFWSNYENFPLFMSNVREVQDLGGGRSHWSVRGPGGAPIRWNARVTDERPNEVIAWRSEPDAMLENAGIIRFRQDGTGTRLDLRFCYRPPAGGAGQAVVELLGADPRAKLNEDLSRLKALLEATVRSGSHGQESGS